MDYLWIRQIQMTKITVEILSIAQYPLIRLGIEQLSKQRSDFNLKNEQLEGAMCDFSLFELSSTLLDC